MNKSIFKAYDIRGKYPEELNEETVFNIAAAVGKHFERAAKIVVGHDVRLSSPSLYKAVFDGLKSASQNLEIIPAGIMTTPMLYFLVNKLKAGGGIMVTASHNPKEYNGLKVVGEKARPISGKEVATYLSTSTGVRLLQRQSATMSRHLDSPNGETKLQMPPKLLYDKQAAPNKVLLNLYINFLKNFLRPTRKLKVVFDCSNGTTGLVIKNLVSKVRNLEAILINDRADGNFSAHGPNPLLKGATGKLEKEVKKQKADLGVIFDADGDRVFFVDNRGQWIDPNESAYILTRLFKPPYVVGIVSSQRLKKERKVFISRVGHYFFKKLMREKKASLGLEHSGHYYFKDFFYCDSGIFAAIQVINFVSGLETDLADWLDKLPKYYRSGEINFEVKDKEKVLKKIENEYNKKKAKYISKLDGLTMEFPGWWFNVRPSNTESLLRLNMEARDKKLLDQKLKEIKKFIY